MSLGLIKPGASAALRHTKTGMILVPIGYLKNGTAVWPVAGASPDDDTDPDNARFTGGSQDDDDQDDDEEDEDDEDEDDDPPKKKSKKSKRSSDDDDEDEDDEDDDPKLKASRQARRYRLALRAEQEKNREMASRLKALEDKDKEPDEVQSRDLAEANAKLESLTEVNRIMSAQLAFFKSNTITWADPSDAFALAEREGLFDDVIDEDGTVDASELRRSLKDLAKRKPYLVKKDGSTKARGRKTIDDDEEEDDDEPRSRRSGSTMNSRRKGSKAQGPSRAELAKRFPVLNSL